MPAPLSARLLAASMLAVALAVVIEARAVEPVLVAPPPQPSFSLYVDRGYSLPAPQAFGLIGVSAWRARDSVNTTLDVTLGGAIGLTEKLGLEASFGTVAVAPGLRWHSPQVGLFYTPIDTPPFELDLIGRLTFDTDTDRIVERAEPGFLAIMRVPHVVRFDVSPFLTLAPTDSGLALGARVPLAVGFQLAEHYHCVLSTGLEVDDLRSSAPTITVPAGIAVGYSETFANGMGAGIVPSLRFPEALRIGPESPAHGVAISGTVVVYVVSPP